MRHYWLIIRTENLPGRLEAESVIRTKLPAMLAIYPDQVAVKVLNDSNLAISVFAKAGSFRYEQPYQFDDQSALLVAGLPTLERFAVPPTADIASSLSDLLEKTDAQDIFHKAGGYWSIGQADTKGIKVFSDFSGYSSCYYFSDQKVFAVGNSAKLVSMFNGYNDSARLNWRSLSWIASTTMIWGNETAYVGVNKIPPGAILQLSEKGLEPRVRSFTTNFFTPVYLPTESDKQEYIREVVDRMCNRINWYIQRGITFHTHLTGGKDTRMILALLIGSGAINRVEKIATTGEEDNGDVIVARRLAAACGLEKQHRVRPGNKSKKAPTAAELANRFFFCASRYDGQLTPFDGRDKEQQNHFNVCTLMGGGGEIYRNKLGIQSQDPELVYQNLLKFFCPFDKLQLLSDTGREWQSTFMHTEISHYADNNMLNPEMKFYIDQRLSNWGTAHMQSSAGTQIPPLLDFDLARLMASNSCLAEEIHFSIIRYACPNLLREPFLNQRWAGVTREKAASLGFDIDPINVPVAKSFPWQFESYTRLRDVCLDMTLDNFMGFEPWLSRSNIISLRKKNVHKQKYNSADIKMVFGLAMAAGQLAHDHGGYPDYMPRPQENHQPVLRGEASQLFEGPWLQSTSQEQYAPVADLEKRFRSTEVVTN